MNTKKKSIKMFNTISLFLIIFLTPLIINFYQTGPTLKGDKYQTEIAYIENSIDLFNHLFKNLVSNLNIFTNSIFWFFIIAYLTQKTIKWINSD